MIKLVYCITKKAGLTDEEFFRYWENIHGPIGESGLLGISETSSDMRNLLEHETQDMGAAEAVALFCYQVKKWIGAFAAALGGLDTLVFAGGIGGNAPPAAPGFAMGWDSLESNSKKSETRRMRA